MQWSIVTGQIFQIDCCLSATYFWTLPSNLTMRTMTKIPILQNGCQRRLPKTIVASVVKGRSVFPPLAATPRPSLKVCAKPRSQETKQPYLTCPTSFRQGASKHTISSQSSTTQVKHTNQRLQEAVNFSTAKRLCPPSLLVCPWCLNLCQRSVAKTSPLEATWKSALKTN